MKKEKNKGKIWLLILAIILVCIVAIIVLGIIFSPKTITLEESGNFDKQTIKQQAEEVIVLLNEENYNALFAEYANEILATEVSKQAIQSAKSAIASDWGEMKQIQTESYYEMVQNNNSYAVAILEVEYEKITVTYTLSFDTNSKLAGIYLK
jgi:Tfp pilus assembly protein PilN